MRMAIAAGLLGIALAAGAARAEPIGTPDPEPGPRSPAIALSLSAGITGAGAALVFAGSSSEVGQEAFFLGAGTMLVGPSIGRWYAGSSSGVGVVARGTGALVMLTALMNGPDVGCDEEHEVSCDDGVLDGGWDPLFYTGAALWVGSTIYDIVRAPLDARDFNRAHEVTVAPVVVQGARVPGLAVSGRF